MAYKKEFESWKQSQTDKGFVFLDSLPTVQDMKVGDKVIFMNDYGVAFGPYEVLAFAEPEQGRCIYIDYDCYWLPTRERNLMPEEEFYRKAEQWLMETSGQLDWKMLIYTKYIELSKCTSHGLDFTFTLGRNSIYQTGIYEHYVNYDPSEETMKWVDASGHGKNGAPYELEDVLADMKEVKESLKTLFRNFKEYSYVRFIENSL